MQITLDLDIMPVPQGRPRFFVRRKGLKQYVGAYDPQKSKTYKEIIAWHAKIKALDRGLKSPIKGPIAISLIFSLGVNGGKVFHTKRPDIDNLAKAVKDALNGIIYEDDSQIVEAHLFKRCGPPSVQIDIVTLEE